MLNEINERGNIVGFATKARRLSGNSTPVDHGRGELTTTTTATLNVFDAPRHASDNPLPTAGSGGGRAPGNPAQRALATLPVPFAA
ncbi:MAG TPA: hypothetical protein PK981_02075, partial [Accumulibacter sp.]|nr:hypothetical protein [Accumulibacter sp.]HMX23101.1 hypothetical protein [Accumulibacter sp.]HND80276.1 hypothetical protein [Accumulibacter sp.]HNG37817.1 hypothetical protein [Accumulibacter sp.]HNL13785.1 hypothetical protein [Accumulibacter sp.]